MNTLAIIGIGRWGKNLVREFNEIADIKYSFSAGEPKNIKWLKQCYPHIRHTSSFTDILKDRQVDAIIIATPIKTHYQIAREALKAHKHVFVEKPLAIRTQDADALLRLAKKNNCALFVGHTFLYHPIFEKIKKIHKDEHIMYANCEWQKYGSFCEDIIWNLLIHDTALLLTLFGNPVSTKLQYKKGVISACDIITAEFSFSKNIKTHIYINRASNIKRKTITFITAKNNIYVWDDNALLRLNQKTKIFKSIMQTKKTPLALECIEFLKAIKTKHQDSLGLDVINVLSKLK